MKAEDLPAPQLRGGRPNLVLAGFSGTGKTVAGERAAAILEMPFFDLDRLAEVRLGKPIADVFAGDGEAAFRAVERELLRQASRLSGAVIATGGGAVLHPEMATLAAPACSVPLSAGLEQILARLGGAGDRPMLRSDPRRRTAGLLEERRAAYAALGDWLPTDGRPVEEVARELARRYQQHRSKAGSTPLQVELAQGAYPIHVVEGEEEMQGLLLASLPPKSRVLIVTDAAAPVAASGADAAAWLCAQGRQASAISVERGEASKRVEVLQRLWDHFQAVELDRGDCVVAMGGGAALDAAGFAAASWARGVPWLTLPTTLLAMVDAAIGGKVAIDHPLAKNAIGAFHHPLAVISQVTFLKTLEPEICRDGLGEVVKSSALASPLLLDRLGEEPATGSSLPTQLPWLVRETARIKAAYVAEDPEDHGVRQSLNLGHTYAHCLEVATDYRLSHGRAVALGLLASAALGRELGLTPQELPGRLESALGAAGLLQAPPQIDRELVEAAWGSDKKRRGGVAAVLCPTGEGAQLVRGLDRDVALAPLWAQLEGLGAAVPSGPAPIEAGASK
ncbi:MAG: bifunctional shikimate kinase/3-dehydroquinate synthase [Candidatus Dormibacteria bacterium]